MKLTLMIEGDASLIAMIVSQLPNGATVSAAPAMPPVAPAPIPPMPAGDGGVPGDDGDDDNGVPNAAAPDVDSAGMPWDDRIHASTKNVNADGTWKMRRGGPKGDALAAIEAELRAKVANNTAQQLNGVPPVAQAPVPPMPAGDNAMPPVAPAPIPPVAPAMPPVAPAPIPPVAQAPVPPMPAGDNAMPPVAPAPVAAAPVAAPQMAPAPAPVQSAVAQATGTLDFAQFMQHLSGQMTKRDAAGNPLIHADYLAGITAEIAGAFNVQLAAITDIASDPNKINYAVQLLQRDQRW